MKPTTTPTSKGNATAEITRVIKSHPYLQGDHAWELNYNARGANRPVPIGGQDHHLFTEHRLDHILPTPKTAPGGGVGAEGNAGGRRLR